MASSMQQAVAQLEAAKPQRGAVLHSQRKLPVVYVISGVSGSGKRYLTAADAWSVTFCCNGLQPEAAVRLVPCSTVGRMLAGRLQCPFYEGDDYHSAQARGGVPCLNQLMLPWHGCSDDCRPW